MHVPYFPLSCELVPLSHKLLAGSISNSWAGTNKRQFFMLLCPRHRVVTLIFTPYDHSLGFLARRKRFPREIEPLSSWGVRARLRDVRSGLTVVTFGSALSWLGKSQPQLIGVWTQTRQQGYRKGLGPRSGS